MSAAKGSSQADASWRSAWARDATAVANALDVDPARGLDDAEVFRRRSRWGPNQLKAARPKQLLEILVEQFRSIVILLLLAAGLLSLVMADVAEGVAILAVIAINAGIGFVTEWRATRSMEALQRFARVEATVIRNGIASRGPASELVPGDVVLLDAGDVVPADLRLIETAKMQADESALTGESLPVQKITEPLPEQVPVLDRENMAYKGTAITHGSGRGIVVATALQTEFGKIFQQVSTAEPRQTPLEKRLDALGTRLVWAVIVMAALLAMAGVVAGRDTALAIQVAIALAVAAIPEGLPIVATIALARGMWRMARHNALITRLSAVETLGATNIILTDKTGTLTENQMRVTRVELAGGETIDIDSVDDRLEDGQDNGKNDRKSDSKDDSKDDGIANLLDPLFDVAALCSNASLQVAADGSLHRAGDPTELALLEAASQRGIWRNEKLSARPELREEPFDADSKRMATFHRDEDGVFVAVKGAPEAVIPLCTAERWLNGEPSLDGPGREEWLRRADALGALGLRTLALAQKRTTDVSADPYQDLVLLGIVGLEDPAREGVAAAIRGCRDAGVEVVMVTGDHAATACRIAVDTGIVTADELPELHKGGSELEQGPGDNVRSTRVFSRVTPAQKLSLIDLHQQADKVVAMTGDGVNDAPALKKADIGVAMGVRGTAVAREAAAMVLQDDQFRTIVMAIAQGRVIFGNIRKFVVYLMSCNISEVLVVSLATLAGAPLPLLPLQILFLNLVTDVFPALALGVGAGPKTLMKQKPRPAGERILTNRHWLEIVSYGALISVTVLAAMATAALVLDFEPARAVTVSFLTLALAQLWHVFSMRAEPRRWIDNEITRNPWVWAALVLCLVLVVTAVYQPQVAAVLQLTDPGAEGWGLVLVSSLVPVLFAPVLRRVARRLAGD